MYLLDLSEENLSKTHTKEESVVFKKGFMFHDLQGKTYVDTKYKGNKMDTKRINNKGESPYYFNISTYNDLQ